MAAIAVPGRLSARRTFASPAALLFSVVFAPIVVAVVSALWRAAAEAKGGTIAGYSGVALTWYLATSEASILCIPTKLIEDTGLAIGSGAVSAELLRPRRAVLVRLALEVGAALAKLVVILPVVYGLALLVGGRPPSLPGLVLVVPSIALAVSCNVAGQLVVASSAFWLRDATSAWFLHQKAVFLLGGMLIPPQVLPGALGAVAPWLPFASMAYAPARLASGHVEPHLLVVQAAWLAVLVLAAVGAFAAGERRLTGAHA